LKKSAGVAITFDDQNIDNWYMASYLFQKYQAKATFFVDAVNILDDSQWQKLKSIESKGNEIGFHGLYHLNAQKFLQCSSTQEYMETEIIDGLKIMKNKGFKPQSFAYPYGCGDSRLDKELLKYFSHIRYTLYTNKETRVKDLNKAYLSKKKIRIIYGVGMDQGYGNSLKEIKEGLDRAKKNQEILVLYGHDLTAQGNKSSLKAEELEDLLQYCTLQGLKFYTVSELE